jgi:excisionase family DNA binding protein
MLYSGGMIELHTQAEVAEIIRVSERTLERWRLTGNGPPFCKLGRRVLYRRGDLDEWVAAHILHSTSEIGR